MKNMIKKIKEDKNIQKVIGIILIFLLLLVFIIVRLNTRLTPVEKIKLTELSNNIVKNIEYVEQSKSNKLDKYINYTMEYFYNEKNKDTLSVEEVVKFINNTFDIKINKEELIKLSQTEELLNNHVLYEPSLNKYKIEKQQMTYSDIASNKIIKYDIDKIIKKNKNKFIITYKKYEVSNPYKILNYYTNLNNKNINSKNKKTYDTKEIEEYLKGNKKVSDIKKYITDKNIKKVGKVKDSIKIIYKVKDSKILVEKITK